MSTITEETFRKLKQQVESAKNEAAKAQGALDQLVLRLRDEFGCDSLKVAKAKLETLEEDRDEAKAAFDKALLAYEKKWQTEEEE